MSFLYMVGMICKTCTENYGLGMDAMIYFTPRKMSLKLRLRPVWGGVEFDTEN